MRKRFVRGQQLVQPLQASYTAIQELLAGAPDRANFNTTNLGEWYMTGINVFDNSGRITGTLIYVNGVPLDGIFNVPERARRSLRPREPAIARDRTAGGTTPEL